MKLLRIRSILNVFALITLSLLAVVGCGGESGEPNVDATYTVAGSLSGLRSGSAITLLSTSSTMTSWTKTTISGNGRFVLDMPVKYNGSYSITIGDQPPGQTCSVVNGSGAGVVSDVSSAAVVCSDLPIKISGTVSGLEAGKSLRLLNNGADSTTILSNGPFEFALPVALNGSYLATVLTQPSNQTCTVNNGSGSGVTANVSSIAVVCSNAQFVISGKVVGLNPGTRLTLFNNAVDPITLSEDGAFKFPAPIALNGSYAVTVATQPIGKTCTVNNGSGAGITTDVSTVAVLCSDTTYSVTATVSGLGSGKQVTLLNNRADPITVQSNGTFRFTTPIVFGGNYSVTVGTQPNGQVCTVNDGTGAGVTLSVINVSVVCSDRSYKLAGTVSGLGPGKQLTILNNDSTPLVVSNSGPFTFSTGVAFNTNYDVTVQMQPSGQTCTVYDAKGKVTSDVSSVTILCSDSSFKVSGSVTGLSAGDFLVLQNNGTDKITIVSNGPFSFSPSALSSDYRVTVYKQPANQSCFVNFGAGLVSAANPVIIQCVNGTGLAGAGN